MALHYNVIHAGIYDGEEIPEYLKLYDKILCFEPLSTAYETFTQKYPDIPCIKAALGSNNYEADFYKAERGSSLFTITNHPATSAWNIEYKRPSGTERVSVRRLDFYDIKGYDYLVLDTQGNEMDVLLGCGKLLNQFKKLQIELSETPLYHGECSGQEIIGWLKDKGFKQSTPLLTHGDVIFERTV